MKLYSTVRKSVPVLFLILITSSCSNSVSDSNSAQEKRNNFDACKISYLQEVPDSVYKQTPDLYDKQADAACSPLLTMDATEAKNFKVEVPSVKVVTKEELCAVLKKAAFAHREFGKKGMEQLDDLEPYYERIRLHIREAIPLLQKMGDEYSQILKYAEDAQFNSYGFNGTWEGSEGRLFASCGITKESVVKDSDAMFGY